VNTERSLIYKANLKGWDKMRKRLGVFKTCIEVLFLSARCGKQTLRLRDLGFFLYWWILTY
jgi:hypothetical protein